MAVTLYRLHVAKGRGNASWGEAKIYESRDEFERDVVDALLDVMAKESSGWRLGLINQCKSEKDADVKVTRIIATQQLVDGEWVDLVPTLHPPRLDLGYAELSDPR
jgi:hypothetical protein